MLVLKATPLSLLPSGRAPGGGCAHASACPVSVRRWCLVSGRKALRWGLGKSPGEGSSRAVVSLRAVEGLKEGLRQKEIDIIENLKGRYDKDIDRYAFTMREQESEGDVEVVEGSIPDGFPRGAYLRNGPNARFFDKDDHLFDGDGMIHGTVIAEDGSLSYFARWIHGKAFALETQKNKRLFGGVLNSNGYIVLKSILLNMLSTGQQFKDTSNTNIFYHGGHLLALMEVQLPAKVEIGPRGMRTADPEFDFGGTLKHRFTAHPKVDPETGDLYVMGYREEGPPFLEFSVIRDGRVQMTAPVDVGRPCMMHDWAITENYLVIMDLPIVFKVAENLIRGKSPFGYYPEDEARFGIVRKDTGELVRWFPVEAANVFHTANAFEDPATGEVVVYGARSESFRPPFYENFNPAFIHEWRMNLETGAVSERQVCGRAIEFPRVNERFLGRESRFAYTVEASMCATDASELHGHSSPKEAVLWDNVLKMNMGTGQVPAQYEPPHGTTMGEVTFVPRPGGTEEDDGWLVGYMACGVTEQSFLGIIDARDMRMAAKLKLPSRVPVGLHGNFVPLEAVTLS